MKVLVITMSVLVFFLLIAGVPVLYNYQFHSLAKFSNSIRVGDSEADVKTKVSHYCEKHKSDMELQCKENGLVVGIYQSGFFDNVQANITFENKLVSNVQYIGD